MVTHPRLLSIQRVWSVALALAALLSACGGSNGTDAATESNPKAPSRQTFVAGLTEVKPASSSGFFDEIHYRDPADPTGKPYAVERIVIQLPPGLRIDTSVPEQCTATDPELLALGADACPANSQVGGGLLTLDFGGAGGPVPRFIEGKITLFNNSDELIFFIETTNTPLPQKFVARTVIEGDRFVTTSPPLPSIPPPDPDAFAAIKDAQVAIDPVANSAVMPGAAYITTPDSCPISGQWTITATFTYRDGVTETVESLSPCAS